MIKCTPPKGTMVAAYSRCERALSSAKIAPWRSIAEFATQEIIIPTGPFIGRRFNLERQPWLKHLYHEIDREVWQEIICTGPSQSGKTLSCFTIPILWHLFERNEDVIVMAPTDDTCVEKWDRDLLPTIEKTRFEQFLPKKGAGSRGGFDTFQRFGHGRFLKWMTAGGSDKSRAHYTARVIVMTEVDGMATTDTTSLESDKVKQVEARGNAYADRKVVYKECTVTVPTGHIWQRYKFGTASRLVLHCPHCSGWVSPEREHFSGWQECETDVAAKQAAAFYCPSCGERWSDDDRRKANEESKLLHEGQKIEGDEITGKAKQTLVLGFRWSAVNNLLETSGNLGVQEWSGANDTNRDNAERKLLQFNWCVPYDDPNFTLARLDPREVQRRQGHWQRGYIPEDASYVTVGVDVQKRLLYWTVLVSWDNGRRHIVDYGRTEVPSDDLGVEVGIKTGLSDLRDQLESGWPAKGGNMLPSEVWIDAGAWSDIIYEWLREPATDRSRYRPTLGRGFGQQQRVWYNKPKSTGNLVKYVGSDFHVSWYPTARLNVVEINADAWKTRLHSMLTCGNDTKRRMTLFTAPPQEHVSFASHLSAEHQEEKFTPERGRVVVWRAHSRNNHWLDSTSLALVASCAIEEYRLYEQKQTEQQQRRNDSTESDEERWGGISLERVRGNV